MRHRNPVLSLLVILQLCYIASSFVSYRRIKHDIGDHCKDIRRQREDCKKGFCLCVHADTDTGSSSAQIDGDLQDSTRKRKNYRPNSNKNKKGILINTFRKAKNAEHTGDYIKAIRLLRKCLEIDERDAHSYLALARITQKLDGVDSARVVFRNGLESCGGSSVHLLQAWATLEMRTNNTNAATQLFEQALQVDKSNPYVCHSYGLMSLGLGDVDKTRMLWRTPLSHDRASAALICSLGELETNTGNPDAARTLFEEYGKKLKSPRERTEIALAYSLLEEKHFKNLEKASVILRTCLQDLSVDKRDGVTMKKPLEDSRLPMALAKLEGRQHNEASKRDDFLRKYLEKACLKTDLVKDGRMFNAWASLERKQGKIERARWVLNQGLKRFPYDFNLLQSAGKMEERKGNFTAAREFYSLSLNIRASAPTLVSQALLELKHPSLPFTDEDALMPENPNITLVRSIFEEALLVDPRHGPAYNAYGAMEMKHGGIFKAREIFERGIAANCVDPASLYHGYAKVELSDGNIEKARDLLKEGLNQITKTDSIATVQHERAVFLHHTLGMLELNSHRVSDARLVFQEGIKRHGNSSQLLLGAALSEIRMGNEEAARSFFERSVNADRRHAHAWQAWAVMEMRAGNYAEAKTLFECGLQSCPKHGALWQAYGYMESKLGNFDVARTLFAASVKKCPRHMPTYQSWARLEMQAGNWLQAKRLISEALTLDKNEGGSWLVAATIEEKLENVGLVGLLLRRGIECAPNNPDLYVALAENEIKRGKIDSAREVLEKGLDIDPSHAPLYHSLAELEARVFNLEGLAKLNRRAAEIFNSNALVPSPSSSKAWAKKLKSSRSRKLPKGIEALAERVGIEQQDDDSPGEMIDMVDPISIMGSMGKFENDAIDDILSLVWT